MGLKKLSYYIKFNFFNRIIIVTFFGTKDTQLLTRKKKTVNTSQDIETRLVCLMALCFILFFLITLIFLGPVVA